MNSEKNCGLRKIFAQTSGIELPSKPNIPLKGKIIFQTNIHIRVSQKSFSNTWIAAPQFSAL